MGRPVKKITGYSSSEIRALFNTDDKYKIGIRLYAVYQVSLGKSSRQLEDVYNTSHKQILNWVDRFQAEGIDGLRDREGRGRKSRLETGQKERLRILLSEEQPLGHGYNTATWTGPLLRDWINKQWQVTYGKTQIYTVIKSLGFSYQKSRGFYPGSDKKNQEEFKEGLKKTS